MPVLFGMVDPWVLGLSQYMLIGFCCVCRRLPLHGRFLNHRNIMQSEWMSELLRLLCPSFHLLESCMSHKFMFIHRIEKPSGKYYIIRNQVISKPTHGCLREVESSTRTAVGLSKNGSPSGLQPPFTFHDQGARSGKVIVKPAHTTHSLHFCQH